jgi:type IV secretion system protein VirB8
MVSDCAIKLQFKDEREIVALFKKKDEKQKNLTKLKNWYQDRYESVLIQRNLLFLCMIAFIGIFAFTILGIIELNSKKVYEPFIVQVEENTGIITKVNNEAIRTLPTEKAVRNASLVRYVLAREGYNYADYSFNYYQIARLMSNKNVYQDFVSGIDANNPESPVSLGFDKRIDVRIKSLIDLDESQNLVQIRIEKAVLGSGVVSSEDNFRQSKKSYIITLRYEYKDLDLSETERYINPLGLQVIAYSINEEINAKSI